MATPEIQGIAFHQIECLVGLSYFEKRLSRKDSLFSFIINSGAVR